MNKMSEKSACIHGRALFETSQLIKVDKVVEDYMELKMFANDLLDKLF